MIDIFIGNYQREIDNLKWSLDTNKDFLSNCDIERIETRIRDREQFIEDLKRIKKNYE